MKTLMIYCKKFGYTPSEQTLDIGIENAVPANFENIQTAFIQAEAEDEANEKSVESKLVKNLKWICGKNGCKHIILHSFAHLSESKANPEFTMQLFNRVEERLKNAGYQVHQTPFGYFLDLQMDAPGFSLARVFKSF